MQQNWEMGFPLQLDVIAKSCDKKYQIYQQTTFSASSCESWNFWNVKHYYLWTTNCREIKDSYSGCISKVYSQRF